MDVKINTGAVKNFNELSVDMRILLSILNSADETGKLELDEADKKDTNLKTFLAKTFNVTEQTISNHLRLLVSSNIIKYRYIGVIFINPNFCYKGNLEDFEIVQKKYAEQKCDIKIAG